jgi:methylenetetrahydrofolate reductase (NADPH)
VNNGQLVIKPSSKHSRAHFRYWSVRHARLWEVVYQFFLPTLRFIRPVINIFPDGLTHPIISKIERSLKGIFFDCNMCGDCVLSSTGMSCPMNCPKHIRNGPCGGVRENGNCEIEPDMKCVWLDAWSGAAKMKNADRNGWQITNVQLPLDSSLDGRSSWLAVMNEDINVNISTHSPTTKATVVESKSPLRSKFDSGKITITAEYNPPDTTDPARILAGAQNLLEVCDAINVTDGAGGNTHISSLSVCTLLVQAKHNPVMQISCRDKNRIAIQGEALGAAALGIKNILCLTGDGISSGDQPSAKPVFDLDCSTLLTTLKMMRDESQFTSGKTIDAAPDFYLGATANPCAISAEIEIERIAKKIDAGAQFIQTQFCFDPEAFHDFYSLYTARGLQERARLLVGVGPISSAKAGLWMRNNIAGIRIPDRLIERLEQAYDQKEEGMNICVELIQGYLTVDHLAGFHIMAFQQPNKVAEIIRRVGL